MRILVVDDDADFAWSQVMLLKLFGYEVDVCTVGTEAIGVIEQTRPDVVLLDLAMPRICGLDIAEELQRRPELRPRLLAAVTGFESAELHAQAAAAGFDQYFVKPIELAKLQTSLETLQLKDRRSK